MRWRILRTLLEKEVRRHVANRGGVVMILLLLGMALLLSAYGQGAGTRAGAGFVPGVYHCCIDYWRDDEWIEHLRRSVPEALRNRVHFRDMAKARLGKDAVISYPMSTGAIQIRPGQPRKIWCWHPGDDPTVMAPFESWFWRASRGYFRDRLRQALANANVKPEETLGRLETDDSWIWRESHERFLQEVDAVRKTLPEHSQADLNIPALTFERSALDGKPVGTRTTIATALVLFALFFVCVYLLPSLSCEERERGLMLAQALSPASALEILGAKFLFYPVAAVSIAGALGVVSAPAAARSGFFWATLVVLAFSSMGIGLTISCIARTQRSASMGALGYVLVVSMVLLVCQQSNIGWLPQVFVEYHGPRLMHAAMTGSIEPYHPYQLCWTAVLAACWNFAAWMSFRRFGWQ